MTKNLHAIPSDKFLKIIDVALKQSTSPIESVALCMASAVMIAHQLRTPEGKTPGKEMLHDMLEGIHLALSKQEELREMHADLLKPTATPIQ